MSEFDDLARFARAADAYCDWIRQFKADDISDALPQVHRLLAELQLSWLNVRPRNGSPSANEVALEDGSVAEERLRALPVKGYRKVFEPLVLDFEVPVIATLSDDLSDIFVDLSEGLQFWRRGDAFDAYWTWDFGYKQHWGRHLLGALTALYHFSAGHFP